MKKSLILLTMLSFSSIASELEVEVTSLSNVKRNGAIEVCGIVKDQLTKTSLVNITHDQSSYTTLTDKNGNWCQVVKRWTFSGIVEATARKL